MTSGTEDKRPNVITKTLPLLSLARKSQGLGAVGQELWIKTKYMFLTNHSITQQVDKDTCSGRSFALPSAHFEWPALPGHSYSHQVQVKCYLHSSFPDFIPPAPRMGLATLSRSHSKVKGMAMSKQQKRCGGTNTESFPFFPAPFCFYLLFNVTASTENLKL